MPLNDAHFGRFSLYILVFDVQYSKPALTIADQVQRLKSRGLKLGDEIQAAHYLSNISYYRLRAYTFPFQDNENPNHPFVQQVAFEDVINLYVFDRQLRLLLFNAIEKIEIALRTQIIYQYAIVHGSHWHIDQNRYNDANKFTEHIGSLEKEIRRSKEAFIDHYRSTYRTPVEPPCWMSLEVSSIGLLSKMFANLRNDSCKTQIAHHFGLKSPNILENWMHCLSVLRNICAHHGRVWNRRMTPVMLPKKPSHSFLSNKQILPYKLYAYLCIIQYILRIINPGYPLKAKFLEIVSQCDLVSYKEMGFPDGWDDEILWQNDCEGGYAT